MADSIAAAVDLNSIVQLFGSLGTGSLFVYLYFRERSESQKTINQKDCDIKELNGRVLTAFEKNAQTTERLSDSIKENTVATQTLTQRVTDVLINGRK